MYQSPSLSITQASSPHLQYAKIGNDLRIHIYTEIDSKFQIYKEIESTRKSKYDFLIDLKSYILVSRIPL